MFSFIIQIVVALVLSAAATLIQQALAKRPEQPRKPGVRGELQVGGDNPLACILGLYATAGQLEYAGTWGTPGGIPNNRYVVVVSVSDLPVRGLFGFYVDGARVTFDVSPHPEFGFPPQAIAEWHDRRADRHGLKAAKYPCRIEVFDTHGSKVPMLAAARAGGDGRRSNPGSAQDLIVNPSRRGEYP